MKTKSDEQQLEPSSFLSDVLMPDPFGDAEIQALMTQEPLPPNQGFQSATEEFPSDDNNNEN